MADFNKTLQQVIGYTNLLGVLNSRTGAKTNALNNEYKNFSDSVRANIRKHGIQKSSMAHIVFDIPFVFKTQQKISGMSKISALATYRAESFTQPGVSMATTEIKRYGVGTIERKPYLPIFTDQTFTFINDSSGLIHKFFYLWMNAIVGFDELPSGNARADIFGKKPFEVEYKDNYKTDISMYIYDETQNKVGVVQFMNAYPLFLGDIARGWGDFSQLVRFPVTFTYSHWKYEDMPSDLRPQDALLTPGRDMSLTQNIMKYASVLQTIASTKKPQNVGDILNVVNNTNSVLRSIIPPTVEPKYTDYYSNARNNE